MAATWAAQFTSPRLGQVNWSPGWLCPNAELAVMTSALNGLLRAELQTGGGKFQKTVVLEPVGNRYKAVLSRPLHDCVTLGDLQGRGSIISVICCLKTAQDARSIVSSLAPLLEWACGTTTPAFISCALRESCVGLWDHLGNALNDGGPIQQL
jgi:hypothetical protein